MRLARLSRLSWGVGACLMVLATAPFLPWLFEPGGRFAALYACIPLVLVAVTTRPGRRRGIASRLIYGVGLLSWIPAQVVIYYTTVPPAPVLFFLAVSACGIVLCTAGGAVGRSSASRTAVFPSAESSEASPSSQP